MIVEVAEHRHGAQHRKAEGEKQSDGQHIGQIQRQIKQILLGVGAVPAGDLEIPGKQT